NVALEALVRDVIEELRPEFGKRRVQIEMAALPDCSADAKLLQHVFMNLLSNAAKYTRGRDLAVIKIGSTPQASECIYFVQDNGAGFDPRYAENLFGVFQRLHTNEQFEGTGI